MKKPVVPAKNAELESLCSALKVIANPNRMRILTRLLDGECSVGEIETELSIKQPTLSQELRNLRDSRLVRTRRESKVVFYSVTDLTDKFPIRSLLNSFFLDTTESLHQKRSPQIIENNRKGECGHFSTVNPAQ